jgi:hypothetical protein
MTYDRTMIVIRERSFLELLDLALLVVRDRPVVLGLTALAGTAPFAVFNIWLTSASESGAGLWILLLLMETPWATAPLTIVLGDLMFGVRPRIGKVLKTLFVRFPAMILTQVVVRGALFLVVVGCVWVPTRFTFVNEVLLLERSLTERSRAFRTFRRSQDIARAFEGELFIRWIGQVVLGATFALCFQNGVETLGTVLGGGELSWEQSGQVDVGDVLFQIGVWIAIAFFAVVHFLSYIDRRIRLEGWEIELRLRTVGRALEERQQ